MEVHTTEIAQTLDYPYLLLYMVTRYESECTHVLKGHH